MPWHAYKVGDLYNPSRTRWPEASQWRLTPNGVELALFYPVPTAVEIERVNGGRGPAQFALIEARHVLLFGQRFGDSPWADSPWQRLRQQDMPVGLPDGDGHLLVHVVLVDATTGIIAAQSVHTWPPRFVAEVRRAVAEQVDDEPQAAREIKDLYDRFPSTADLVRDRAIMTCKGGKPN